MKHIGEEKLKFELENEILKKEVKNKEEIKGGVRKGEATKRRIIESVARLFMTKGYNCTGINDILLDTNLPKGSFYYHFKTKKELAIAVADYQKDEFGTWLLREAENRRWNEFVDHFMGQIIVNAREGKYYGCPFAVLGCELAFLDHDITKAYLNPLHNLIGLFGSVLKFSKIEESKIERISYQAMALFEGYILYYRLSKDITILERLGEELKVIV